MEITKDECIRLIVKLKDRSMLPQACREMAEDVQEILVNPADHNNPKVMHELKEKHPYAIIRRSTTTRGKYYKLSTTPEHQETCLELAKRFGYEKLSKDCQELLRQPMLERRASSPPAKPQQ